MDEEHFAILTVYLSEDFDSQVSIKVTQEEYNKITNNSTDFYFFPRWVKLVKTKYPESEIERDSYLLDDSLYVCL